ncbi:MAG: hypothetical protein GTN53_20260, partial [Candidatus Aminicenantes bacterium]|nr:hypothetical protein [Candidatus Aminicenantes bacterium]NIQ68836.1 hypothetical protein [Candidatus Aminicenantes bacterium]NIT24837.1 hypothetical protein [Candidatus Aminicenantes bacterium]
MRKLSHFIIILIASICAFMFVQTASAATIAFEWTEGTNSNHISHHTSGGPVLADDFIPTVSGRVVQVDWWGSAPLSAIGPDTWEITFHPDGPAGTNAPDTSVTTAILSQHSPVVTSGVDPDGDGVYFFSSVWTEDFPGDVTITAGTNYWFSVANWEDGWTWAFAGGSAPTFGSEQYDAVVSQGAPGSPHFGPWTSLENQDFAFRIWVSVPEPLTT